MQMFLLWSFSFLDIVVAILYSLALVLFWNELRASEISKSLENFWENWLATGRDLSSQASTKRERFLRSAFLVNLSSHRLQLKTHALFFKWASCSFDSFTSYAYFSEIYELVFSYSLHERENRISELSNFNTRCFRL